MAITSTTLGTLGQDVFSGVKIPSTVSLNYPTTNYATQGISAAPTVANANILSTGLGGGQTMNPMIQSYQDALKYALGKQKAFDNSFIGQMSPYISGFANVAQGLGSLASIYSGFQMLDMYGDQLDIAKDQWATTKEELNRVRNVRNKLNESY
jgi:hypothetical protein